MKCWFQKALRTSIGSKYVMALTGLMLFGFLIAHLAGNLQFFAGPEVFNAYPKKLRDLGPLLWLLRGGLLLIFVVHVATAIRVSRANRAARPIPYAHSATIQASYASRTMVMSGLITLLYLLYHLAHYTFLVVTPAFRELPPYSVYQMVVIGFSSPLVAGIYILALLVLALHLSHGLSSLFQSLGLNHPKYNGLIKKVGPTIALLLFLGYVSIPLSVLMGVMK